MSSEDVQVELAKIWSRIEALEEKVGMPSFDPETLMQHEWKGKRLGHRHWAEGSLAWGWDFITEFPDETIKALEKGPLTIDDYVFTLGEKVVNVKKEG